MLVFHSARQKRPASNDVYRSYTKAILVLVAVLSSGCGSDESEQAAKGPQSGERPPARVRVGQVELRKAPPQVTVIGTVVPRLYSIVASGADGIVAEFHVEEGDWVKQGDPLSVLRMVTTELGIKQAQAVNAEREQDLAAMVAGSRPEEIEAAEAKMLAAKSLADTSNAKLIRTQELFRGKAVNQDALDDAEDRAETARQVFLATEANLRLVKIGPRKEAIEQARARAAAQQGQVAYLQAEKNKRTTKAPFDGYVTHRHSYQGQWLSKGAPVVTLAYLDVVDVVVNVDQRELPHVQLGQTAEVHVLNESQSHREGKIASINPSSDWKSGSRGFPVKVRLNNEFVEMDGKRQPVLKEGMMAEVTFRGKPIEALFVPKDCIVRSSRGMFVYIFDADADKTGIGAARQVMVETGIGDSDLIQVTGQGLERGMQVVTEGAERLRPFQPIQRIDDLDKDKAQDGQ
jgi:RND family efflux transporter MFP subunit